MPHPLRWCKSSQQSSASGFGIITLTQFFLLLACLSKLKFLTDLGRIYTKTMFFISSSEVQWQNLLHLLRRFCLGSMKVMAIQNRLTARSCGSYSFNGVKVLIHQRHRGHYLNVQYGTSAKRTASLASTSHSLRSSCFRGKTSVEPDVSI